MDDWRRRELREHLYRMGLAELQARHAFLDRAIRDARDAGGSDLQRMIEEDGVVNEVLAQKSVQARNAAGIAEPPAIIIGIKPAFTSAVAAAPGR